jgi:hypothetical protein
VNQTARDFKLNPSVVSRLRAKAHPFLKQRQATESSSKLETLVVANVRQNLETLTAQSIEAGKPEYIQAQPARDLAVLHGVIADKTFRILSAMTPEGEKP